MAMIGRILAIHRELAEIRLGIERANEQARLAAACPPPLMVRPAYEQYGWYVERDTHWLPMADVDLLIVHHDGSPTDQDNDALAIHRYHREQLGWAAIGYHAWIRRDGTIQEGRPLWASGAHAKDHNRRSWGVCLSGNLDKWPPTEEQLWSLISLLRWWLSRRPQAQVVGHNELAGMQTTCPGRHMGMDWLRQQLRGGVSSAGGHHHCGLGHGSGRAGQALG